MQNNLEQFVWLAVCVLALATLLPATQLQLVPVACVYFLLARFVYWWGYLRPGTLGRAPGVQMTFTLAILPGDRAREAAKRFAEAHGLKDPLITTMEQCSQQHTYFVAYGHSAHQVDVEHEGQRAQARPQRLGHAREAVPRGEVQVGIGPLQALVDVGMHRRDCVGNVAISDSPRPPRPCP